MTKHRGHNEGSIFQRERDGRWVAKVTLHDGGRKELVAKTKAEALTRLRDFQKNQEQGVEILDTRQTVAQYLERWLNDVARDTVRPGTFESYASIVRTRVNPTIGKVQLSKLSGQQVQALYGILKERGLSPASIVRTHAVLHRAFDQAVKWRQMVRNPVDDANRPRVPRYELTTLTHGDVAQLIEAAHDGTLRALYAVATTSGLRRGELLGLRWSDVSLDKGTVSVARTAQRVDGQGWVFAEPKTQKGRRQVRLAKMAVTELRRHRKEQAEARLRVGPMWKDIDCVFASEVGTPLEEARLSRCFKADLQKAGLPAVRFHDLRHTAATLLLSKNVHPKVVQEMLGHANIAITLDTYSHVTPDMQEAAVEALDQLFA